MLIPIEWLREYVDAPAAFEQPEALADRLTTTGNEIEEIRESEGGPVFYLKLTPNRADMLSMTGAAREIAALYERPYQAPATALSALGPIEEAVRVEVDALDLCPRYAARIIRGVKIGPSPEWLRKRLEAAGLRSISNVVDVTNYVMLELGHPLHAFDLDLLAQHRILVRRAHPGEKLLAIDGTEVALQPEMLVIADGERAVAIAGVMGGRDTEVHDGTVNILLESAYFNPTSVRRTSKRCGISSAASYRFERGVDPNGVILAADRAAQLIAELAGGTISQTLFDVYPAPIAPIAIPFRVQRCRDLLGIPVTEDEAEAYLSRLGIPVQRGESEKWTVSAPTWRPDLAIEEDVIEEVGRMYGYDRLPETLPTGASGAGRRSEQDRLVQEMRSLLTGLGHYEAVTSTLVASTYLENSGLTASPAWPSTGGAAVPLRNPLSEEFDTLRPSLLPGLLMAAERNLRYGTRDIFLFETGYIHSAPNGGEPDDRLVTAGVLLGSRSAGQWNSSASPADARPADFFTAKGTVEALIHGLGVRDLTAEAADHPCFHPGRSAWLLLGGQRLGLVGELHPRVAQAVDLPRGLFAFELDTAQLLARRDEVIRYEASSRFPRALRDLAVVVDTTVPSARIEAILREAMGEHARGVRLFDVYTGKPIPEGRASLTYSLELGAEDRTLTDAEVEERLANARERLRTELGAEFRG